MKPIRVILAEDHALVRAGFCALLRTFAGVRIAGEASEGYEVLQLVKKERPDIVILDISMPGLNGLEVASKLRQEHPEVRIIILSIHANQEYVLQALRIGVLGYLLKDASPSEFARAIEAVSRGEQFLCSKLSRHTLADYARLLGSKAGYDKDVPRIYQRLTPRQREILQLIAEGNTTKEIAAKLGLSVKTIETHRTQLMDRLDIHDIAGLVRYAIKVGLIKSE